MMPPSEFKLIPTAITMAAVAVVFATNVLKITNSSGIMLADFTSKDEQVKFSPIDPENESFKSRKSITIERIVNQTAFS